MMRSAVSPADAATGFALYVPWWLMRSLRFHSVSSRILEHRHHVGAAGDAPPGHAAREDLGVRGEVRHDAPRFRAAARRHAEAGDHLVHDQQRPGLGGEPAELAQVGRVGWVRAPVRAGRLEDHGGDVAGREGLAHRGGVAGGDDCERVVEALGDAGGVRVRVVEAQPADDEVVPAVEVVLELHDALAAGVGAGEAQRHHRGLGARRREAHALGARHHLQHLLAPLDLRVVRGAEVRAAVERRADRVHHLRAVVAEQQRAVAADVVDVLVAVDVPLARPARAVDVDRPRGEGAGVVRDAGGEDVAGARGEPLRACVHRLIGLEDGAHRRSPSRVASRSLTRLPSERAAGPRGVRVATGDVSQAAAACRRYSRGPGAALASAACCRRLTRASGR